MNKKSIFIRRKTILQDADDKILSEICEKITNINPEVIAGYSKNLY